MLAFLVFTGLSIGVLSGMLGIGGGILIAPVLLYLPARLGLPALTMKSVSGLTMVQGLVGSASGFMAHRRYRVINPLLIYWMGPVIVAASFIGAHLSGFMTEGILLTVFGIMALSAAILILVKTGEEPLREEAAASELDFNRPLAVLLAATVGFTGGLVGQGGSFLMVPALINILGIPTKIALGSNLGIVLLSSLAGLGGKISAGLVEPLQALALVAGVIPGAQLGGYLSHRLNNTLLKRILAVVIALTSFRIWWTVLEPVAAKFISALPPNLVFLYIISISGLILGIINACLLVWLIITYTGQVKQKEHSTLRK